MGVFDVELGAELDPGKVQDRLHLVHILLQLLRIA